MKTDTMQALEQLVQAAVHLQEHWDECIEKDYPFSDSFDEVVDDLLFWLVSVRLRRQIERE